MSSPDASPEPADSRSARMGFSLPAPVWASPSPAFGELRFREHLRLSHPEVEGHSLRFLRPFAPNGQLLRRLLTFRSRIAPSPFQAQGEISPRKNAILRRTTTRSTPPLLDHESLAVYRLLALIGTASNLVLVHRLEVSLHASSPRSVTLTQLRFASFTVDSLREDFHLQDRTHAGRTHWPRRTGGPPGESQTGVPSGDGGRPPSPPPRPRS